MLFSTSDLQTAAVLNFVPRRRSFTPYQLDFFFFFFPNGPKHVGESDTVSVLPPAVEIRPAEVFCSSASASLQGFHQQTCEYPESKCLC